MPPCLIQRGVFLRRRLGTLAGQSRLASNGFEDQANGRGRRRRRAQHEIFRLVVEQRLELEIVDRGGPGGDEVPAIKLENAGIETGELLLHGVLVAGRSEHPIVLLQLVADRLQMREQPGVKAVVGEEAGYANRVQVCAVGRLEHQRHIWPAALGGNPVLDHSVMRLRLQKRIGSLRRSHARKRRSRLLDEWAIERNLPRLPVIRFEHNLKMLTKQRPAPPRSARREMRDPPSPV